MKRGHPGGFPLLALFAVLLLAAAVLLGPASAGALDRILPLKIKVGDKAPDFALPSSDGKTVRLSDYAGHNFLIDFYYGCGWTRYVTSRSKLIETVGTPDFSITL